MIKKGASAELRETQCPSCNDWLQFNEPVTHTPALCPSCLSSVTLEPVLTAFPTLSREEFATLVERSSHMSRPLLGLSTPMPAPGSVALVRQPIYNPYQEMYPNALASANSQNFVKGNEVAYVLREEVMPSAKEKPVAKFQARMTTSDIPEEISGKASNSRVKISVGWAGAIFLCLTVCAFLLMEPGPQKEAVIERKLDEPVEKNLESPIMVTAPQLIYSY